MMEGRSTLTMTDGRMAFGGQADGVRGRLKENLANGRRMDTRDG